MILFLNHQINIYYHLKVYTQSLSHLTENVWERFLIFENYLVIERLENYQNKIQLDLLALWEYILSRKQRNITMYFLYNNFLLLTFHMHFLTLNFHDKRNSLLLLNFLELILHTFLSLKHSLCWYLTGKPLISTS